ncbi:MAG: hypothetical protein AB7V46_16370, partial [Thermomicrobiales bacterium]
MEAQCFAWTTSEWPYALGHVQVRCEDYPRTVLKWTKQWGSGSGSSAPERDPKKGYGEAWKIEDADLAQARAGVKL